MATPRDGEEWQRGSHARGGGGEGAATCAEADVRRGVGGEEPCRQGGVTEGRSRASGMVGGMPPRRVWAGAVRGGGVRPGTMGLPTDTECSRVWSST